LSYQTFKIIVVEEKRNFKKEIIYTSKMKAGKRRTYFFDIRKSRYDDFYVVVTESTKKPNSETYDSYRLYLYKEDFNRFIYELQKTIDFVKTQLLPDFDFEQFEQRDEFPEDKGNSKE